MITSLAFSPDGERLATGSIDGALRVVDLAAGDEVRLVGTHDAKIDFFQWSPDGRQLASLGRVLRVWDLDRPPAVRSLTAARGRNLRCSPLDWGPQGRRLAVSVDGQVLVLDAEVGSELVSMPGFAVRFDPSGERLAVRGRDATRVVSAANPERELDRTNLGGGGDLCWLAGGEVLALAEGRRVRLWRPGGDTEPLDIETGSVNRLVAAPDGRAAVALLFLDRACRIEAFTGAVSPLGLLERSYDLQALGGRNGALWAAATRRRVIRIGRFGEPDSWFDLAPHSGTPRCVAWSPDGSRVASGGNDRVVRLHDVQSRAEVVALSHDEDIVSVAWSPDGESLASVSDDGVVKIWDARARD